MIDDLLASNLAAAATLVFFCRIVDVSLGAVRTVALVYGRAVTAALLGFFEVLVWITVVSQIIASVTTHPVLLIAYAAGFAAGNAVGVALERRLALGTQVVRIISQRDGQAIADALRERGQAVTTFVGEGRDGPVALLYITCPRKAVPRVLEAAMGVDPSLFYVTETAAAWNRKLVPISSSVSWRTLAKKK